MRKVRKVFFQQLLNYNEKFIDTWSRNFRNRHIKLLFYQLSLVIIYIDGVMKLINIAVCKESVRFFLYNLYLCLNLKDTLNNSEEI